MDFDWSAARVSRTLDQGALQAREKRESAGDLGSDPRPAPELLLAVGEGVGRGRYLCPHGDLQAL